MTDSALLRFYRGTDTDHRGRTLADIRGYSSGGLEHRHDYIQWLFPLPEGSGVLAQAPRLTAEEIAAFAADPALRAALRSSLELMLGFYGLELVDGAVVRPARSFSERGDNWLTAGNHNHLRLTRILRSCTLLGLDAEARALLQALESVAREYPKAISERTLEFWRGAVTGE